MQEKAYQDPPGQMRPLTQEVQTECQQVCLPDSCLGYRNLIPAFLTPAFLTSAFLILAFGCRIIGFTAAICWAR